MRFALDDQITAQPDEVTRLLDTAVPRLSADRPLVFTGIGTSEFSLHGNVEPWRSAMTELEL